MRGTQFVSLDDGDLHARWHVEGMSRGSVAKQFDKSAYESTRRAIYSCKRHKVAPIVPKFVSKDRTTIEYETAAALTNPTYSMEVRGNMQNMV